MIPRASGADLHYIASDLSGFARQPRDVRLRPNRRTALRQTATEGVRDEYDVFLVADRAWPLRRPSLGSRSAHQFGVRVADIEPPESAALVLTEDPLASQAVVDLAARPGEGSSRRLRPGTHRRKGTGGRAPRGRTPFVS